MRKPGLLCICLFAILLFSGMIGCANPEDAPKHETVTLNSADTFYSNGSLLEANVRELTYDGNDASVRIRLTNIGDDPIDGVDGNVRFLDKNGELLFSEEFHIAFEVALYKDETVSVTVACNGKDVKKIASVSVTG